MAILKNGTQPTGHRAFVQAWLAFVCLVGLGACSSYHTEGPEAWWHAAVGGRIAQERPLPPGANDPYPNLSTIPPKPAAANTAEWNKRTTGLISDRLKADQAAAVAPIPAATAVPAQKTQQAGPPQPPSMPQPPGPAQPPGASAALVATSPTPPVAGKAPGPAAAPTSPAATPAASAAAPATKPARPTPQGADVITGTAVLPPPMTNAMAADRVANGQLPALPTQEPARPGIAPAPPPPLVPVTATPPAREPAPGGAGIDFSQGSAALNDAALEEVKALAAERGDHGIAVTGYGDATSSDPLAQSDAITLGLSRANALATALVARGVPYSMLRLNAESAGRGASLRLLQ
jgi:outer membrane protein OmpA-like peptidoglycan-associated protein